MSYILPKVEKHNTNIHMYHSINTITIMFNPKQITLIDCADVDLQNYRLEIGPNVDIVYLDMGTSCNPIFKTDWIKIDAADMTNTHIRMPNDKSQSSIYDLLLIIEHMQSLLHKLSKDTPKTTYGIPTIITDYREQKDKLRIPFIKPFEQDKYDGPIEIQLFCSFNVTSPDKIQDGIINSHYHIQFNILGIDVKEEYNEDNLINDIDDLKLTVII